MSAYLGRRGLEQLRDRLSERDLAVLRSVGEHRFLTARQIEALHFIEHSSDQAGARVCRRVLARLTRDRLLARLRRRVGGVRAGSASFVYALGPAGSRLLDETRRRFTEPSALFLDHTLAVADAHIALVSAARNGQLELLSVEVEPDCWRRYIGSGGAPKIIRPDLYVVTASGAFEDCWFLEIDRATESPAAISRKCHAYQAYWRSGREQELHGTFPLVTWVAPDKERAKRLDRMIVGARNLNRELFRTTASESLVELIAGGAG
jgi:hypothetical protein